MDCCCLNVGGNYVKINEAGEYFNLEDHPSYRVTKRIIFSWRIAKSKRLTCKTKCCLEIFCSSWVRAYLATEPLHFSLVSSVCIHILNSARFSQTLSWSRNSECHRSETFFEVYTFSFWMCIFWFTNTVSVDNKANALSTQKCPIHTSVYQSRLRSVAIMYISTERSCASRFTTLIHLVVVYLPKRDPQLINLFLSSCWKMSYQQSPQQWPSGNSFVYQPFSWTSSGRILWGSFVFQVKLTSKSVFFFTFASFCFLRLLSLNNISPKEPTLREITFTFFGTWLPGLRMAIGQTGRCISYANQLL